MNSPKESEDIVTTEDTLRTKEKLKVVVTGFGPFRYYDVNPSWVVVQELKKICRPIDEFDLVIREIPVEYSSVQEIVPKLWEEHKPKLMVHCGVSAQATSLVLEAKANNLQYISPDVCGNLPPENCCCQCGDSSLLSKINLELVSQEINNTGLEVIAAVSKDAGRYLCEFVYYTSLNINPNATSFIHVPELNQPYTKEQLANGLYVAIKCMLKQLN